MATAAVEAITQLRGVVAKAIGADANETTAALFLISTKRPMLPPTQQRVDSTQMLHDAASIARPKSMPITVGRFGSWNSTIVRIIVGQQWLTTHCPREWAAYCAAILTDRSRTITHSI